MGQSVIRQESVINLNVSFSVTSKPYNVPTASMGHYCPANRPLVVENPTFSVTFPNSNQTFIYEPVMYAGET